MRSDCAVIVFAKAPIPGYAKSRLARVIGDAAAARLAARMLDATLTQAVRAGIGPVTLCCTPDEAHPAFQHAREQNSVTLTRQGDSDLGRRMCRSLQQALQTHTSALLMGTDVPQLDANYLRQAAEGLQSHSAVFVPTVDGGYALIGVSRHIPLLFEDIAWGTACVMQQSRERLASLGISWQELPMLRDIDEPQDLVHLPQGWLE